MIYNAVWVLITYKRMLFWRWLIWLILELLKRLYCKWWIVYFRVCKYLVIWWFWLVLLPMSYSSTGTSSSHDNGMEGEVVSSSPAWWVCNLSIIFLLVLLKHLMCLISLHVWVTYVMNLFAYLLFMHMSVLVGLCIYYICIWVRYVLVSISWLHVATGE